MSLGRKYEMVKDKALDWAGRACGVGRDRMQPFGALLTLDYEWQW